MPLSPAVRKGREQYWPLKIQRAAALTAHSSKLPGCPWVDSQYALEEGPTPCGSQGKSGTAEDQGRTQVLPSSTHWSVPMGVSVPTSLSAQLRGQELDPLPPCTHHGLASVHTGVLDSGVVPAIPGIVCLNKMQFL